MTPIITSRVRVTDRERVYEQVKEKDWLDQVVRMARVTGWRVFHPLPAMNARGRYATWQIGDTGFPDVLAAKPPRLLVAELKAQKGVLTENQQRWLEVFRGVPGLEVKVWRPSDIDEVWATLSGTPSSELRR